VSSHEYGQSYGVNDGRLLIPSLGRSVHASSTAGVTLTISSGWR
jgi:hypothetical protein